MSVKKGRLHLLSKVLLFFLLILSTPHPILDWLPKFKTFLLRFIFTFDLELYWNQTYFVKYFLIQHIICLPKSTSSFLCSQIHPLNLNVSMDEDHLAMLKENLHYSVLVKAINFLMLNFNSHCLTHLINFHQWVQVKAVHLRHLLLDFTFLVPHLRPFMIMIAKEYPKIDLKAWYYL